MAQRERATQPTHVDGRSVKYLRYQEEDISAARELAYQVRFASVEWLASLSSWDLYATLTYDPRRAGLSPGGTIFENRPPKAEVCESHAASYIKALSDGLGRMVSATMALEYTKSYWPHFHALLSLEGCDRDEFKLAGSLWYTKRGFALLSRVAGQDTTPIAAYLTKYFTKQNCSTLLLGPLGNVTRTRQLRLVT